MVHTNRSDPIQIAPEIILAEQVGSSTAFSLAIHADELSASLSAPRMRKFLLRTKGDKVLALKLYEWNADLAAALLFPLQTFEVCMRNAIIAPVEAKWPDWWVNPTFWGITPELTKCIQEAKAKATENRNGFEASGPDIIAACSLRVWRELCKQHYWMHIWKKGQKLAFPYRDEAGDMTDVHRIVDNVLKLRNRVAHHEPILGSMNDVRAQKLADRYEEILTAIGWVSPVTAAWVAARSLFPATHARRPLADPG